MKNAEKKSIIELINLMKDMYKIIASNNYNDTEYGKKMIVKIVEYLEDELINQTEEYKEIVAIVMKQYKSMFPPRGGLSEFHIWNEDYDIRHKENKKYEQTKKQIEAILSISK